MHKPISENETITTNPDCRSCKFSGKYPNVTELCCFHPERRPEGLQADYTETKILRRHEFCGIAGKRFEEFNAESLSGAIRKGMQEHRQAFDWNEIVLDNNGRIVATSAFGAACFSVFGESFSGEIAKGRAPYRTAMREKFPILTKPIPFAGEAFTIEEWLNILNHQNCWSRSKIAGWLEQFEEGE